MKSPKDIAAECCNHFCPNGITQRDDVLRVIDAVAAAIQAERDAAKPMTVDGVSLQPGASVWRTADEAEYEGEPFVGWPVLYVQSSRPGVWVACLEGLGEINVNCLYSTRAAAESARGGGEE